MTHPWSLAWRFSLRTTGVPLALIAAALLFARLFISLSDMTLVAASFNSFEVIVPFIAGLNAALLFAPDDEPALEVLIAAPRPPVYLIYERLAVLIGLQGGLAVVLSVLTAILMPGVGLFVIIVHWLPPTVAMIGLCLLATLYARRAAFGVLTAIALCVAMAFGNKAILPLFPSLWFMIFYVQPRDVTLSQYLINRLFLLAVGAFALALVLIRMRDEEALLGVQENR